MFFFFSKESQKETVFYLLECKEYFLHLKSEVLKIRKNGHFAKGLVHAKIRPSSYMFFFVSKQSKKETFFDILDSKECFLDLKRETLAK